MTDQICYDFKSVNGIHVGGAPDVQTHSRVEHLARSLWLGQFALTNRMAMYSAYFDESGHPDSGKYLVVAGAVASVEQWVHFEREWKGALEPLGISVFHAADFDQRRAPFDALSDKQREDLLIELASIVCRRVEQTISVAIDLGQHKAVNEKYVFSEMYAFPYPQAGRSCIGRVERWATKHSVPSGDIEYFFEDGAKHKGQLQWIAERDSISIPIFLEKRFAPLQAGDLLAWSHNLYLTSKGKIADPYHRALDKLAASSNEWELIDMRDIDRLPTILGIAHRDPSMKYQCKIIKKDGKRTALVRYWPKQGIEPVMKRSSVVIPLKARLSTEEVLRAADEYDSKRGRVVA